MSFSSSMIVARRLCSARAGASLEGVKFTLLDRRSRFVRTFPFPGAVTVGSCNGVLSAAVATTLQLAAPTVHLPLVIAMDPHEVAAGGNANGVVYFTRSLQKPQALTSTAVDAFINASAKRMRKSDQPTSDLPALSDIVAPNLFLATQGLAAHGPFSAAYSHCGTALMAARSALDVFQAFDAILSKYQGEADQLRRSNFRSTFTFVTKLHPSSHFTATTEAISSYFAGSSVVDLTDDLRRYLAEVGESDAEVDPRERFLVCRSVLEFGTKGLAKYAALSRPPAASDVGRPSQDRPIMWHCAGCQTWKPVGPCSVCSSGP